MGYDLVEGQLAGRCKLDDLYPTINVSYRFDVGLAPAAFYPACQLLFKAIFDVFTVETDQNGLAFGGCR